jgi:pyruvate/2-oxoglutarate dehydrogenase complex dihydrolipoamide acyltransferase (E2) component
VIRDFRTGILVIAAASLAACASTPPAGSSAAAPTSARPATAAAAAPAAAPAAAQPAATTAAPAVIASSTPPGEVPFVTPRGYRLEKRNGEDYYCQRVTRTGSRAKATETCYTHQQITEMRETGQDFMNRMQTSPGTGQSVDGNGGVTNSAVSNMNTPY